MRGPGELTAGLVGAAVRAPWLTLALALVMTIVAGRHAAMHLGIDTDTADMISDRLEWRRQYNALQAAFPHDSGTLLVVVDASTPDLADDVAARLAERIAARDDLVEWVERPGGDPFLERNALLYLDLPELEQLADRLIEMQPVLGRVVAGPDLAALAGLLEDAAGSAATVDADGLVPLLDALAATARRAAHGERRWLSWQGLLAGDTPQQGRRFVVVKPRLDYGDLLPAGPALAAVRALAREVPAGVRVRITGGTAMEHEELETVSAGMGTAALLAATLVAVVLVWGLGSVRLAVVSLVTLVVGLTWTAGFAAAAVGRLNLISIAFAVLYIGLGVDYAIHFALRHRELLADGRDQRAAAIAATRDIGGSLALCALTTGVGFYAFVPTAFAGVSELGIISGTGVLISLLASLTVLPALLVVMQVAAPRRPVGNPVAGLGRWATRRPRWVVAAVVVVGLLSGSVLPSARFDDNPVALRDPGAESVATFRDLLADPDVHPWSLSALVAPDAVDATRARLEAVPEVAETRTLDDFVPADQAAKLAVLTDLDLVLGIDLGAVRPAPALPATDARAALARMSEASRGLSSATGEAGDAARRLDAALTVLGDAGDAAVEAFASDAVAALPRQLGRLGLAMHAQAFTARDLPETITREWRAADGRLRVEASPRDDLDAVDARDRFVRAVTEAVPGATGTPLVYLESGRVVVESFVQAFASALAAIVVLLLVSLRSVRETVLTVSPLLLAGLLTIGAMVLLGVDFNFANVIALPLLLGIGVDNGVHMVHRLRGGATSGGGARPATAAGDGGVTGRAIVVSALTTICGFGNLALSPHPGTASMGIVLSIGLALALACTLVVLPALHAAWRGRTEEQ
ncbi:MAG: MMPL family transporter [Ectothiorhodospiraceae bacterium]|nr:MMPL family transporter [Ectothiorhodospiraceae bacterium]